MFHPERRIMPGEPLKDILEPDFSWLCREPDGPPIYFSQMRYGVVTVPHLEIIFLLTENIAQKGMTMVSPTKGGLMGETGLNRGILILPDLGKPLIIPTFPSDTLVITPQKGDPRQEAADFNASVIEQYCHALRDGWIWMQKILQADYENQQELLRARRTGELERDFVETSLTQLKEKDGNWLALQEINRDTLMSLEEVCWRYNPRAWWLIYKRYPRSSIKTKYQKHEWRLLRSKESVIALWQRKFPEATLPTI